MAEEYGRDLSGPNVPFVYWQSSIPTLPALQQQRKRNSHPLHKCLREAQSFAHNQVRQVINAFLARNIGHKWKMFEESRLKGTGLVLRPVSATSVARGRRQCEETGFSRNFTTFSRKMPKLSAKTARAITRPFSAIYIPAGRL